MNYPYVTAIPEICHQLGITEAIIAPGSRSAPLTIAFARHEQIQCRVIPDERSAGFIAMGIAQACQKPVVLICTSGSAALNFYPAVAEAYFQQVPLLILTADRPPEWVDQFDGQTIRQRDVYSGHVKKSFHWEVDQSHTDAQWYGQRTISEAVNTALEYPQGPCHVNFPFREPLYPGQDRVVAKEVKVIKNVTTKASLSENEVSQIQSAVLKSSKTLIICGQDFYQDQPEVLALLSEILSSLKIPVIGDIISNIHSIDHTILHSDLILSSTKKGLAESLQPELLITLGKSIISKQLKVMLRRFKPKDHWHIQEVGIAADTYQSLTKTIRTTNMEFLKVLTSIQHQDDFNLQKQENYYHIWQIEERKVKRGLSDFFPLKTMGEFEVIFRLLSKFSNGNLHLANSMAVRYANFVGLTSSQSEVKVFCNRGTSGIDGSNSSVVGVSLIESNKLNVLVTGDMAFFYDRNAFWHNYEVPNLRILLLNNHAGGIFRIIKGPSSTPELEDYFETQQTLTAKYVAQEYGFEYLLCDRKSKLDNFIKQFLEDDGQPKIMEVETSSKENKEILASFIKTLDLQKD